MAKCAKMGVAVVARDTWSTAGRRSFRSPSNGAFDGAPPTGKLCRFPPIDIVDLGLARLLIPGMGGRWPSEMGLF